MVAPTSNTIRQAGDVHFNAFVLEGANGVVQDITNQVMGVNIYESLFTPFISGSIHIEDTQDFANLYPLVGQEKIHIDIETPSLQIGNIRQTFHVYKMSDRIPGGDKHNVYTLEFISPEAYVDLNKKISLPLKGNISDIAERLIYSKTYGLESGKKIHTEKTKRHHNFIANYWSPVACLDYLCKHAVGEKDTHSYIFFENRNGFNFMSYEDLTQGPVYQRFVYDKHTRDLTGINSDTKNIERDFTTILDVEYTSVFDQVEKLRKGMFASKFTGFDLHTKKYIEKSFSIYENDKDTKLNEYNPYTNRAYFSQEALHKNYMFASNNFESLDGDTTNFETLQDRLSYLTKMGSTVIDIQVAGRLDYTCGMVVDVALPIRKAVRQQDVEDDVIDNRFSGKYVIGEINHIINRTRHDVRMKLMNDSINTSVDT